MGELKLEEEQREWGTALSVNGLIGTKLLNGLVLAEYRDEELNLKYKYKVYFLYIIWSQNLFYTSSNGRLTAEAFIQDEELTIAPSISLPSQSLSLAFKRQFDQANKLRLLFTFPFYIIYFKIVCFLMPFSGQYVA